MIEPTNSAMTESGDGSEGLVPAVPYRNCSSEASGAARTCVESITSKLVGARPVTAAGELFTSQEKPVAAGESLIVANAFSEGEASRP